MQFVTTKTGIAIVGLIAIFGFLYFFTDAFGNAQFALTIRTNPDLENGLVAHWTFDGPDTDISSTTAEVQDTSGNANDGDMFNFTSEAAAFVSGPLGQALDFDGADDIVIAKDIVGVDAPPFSISAWINMDALPSTLGSQKDIVTKYIGTGGSREWRFSILNTDKLFFDAYDCTSQIYNNDNDSSSFSSSDVGKWEHVGFVIDSSGNYTFYVNGQPEESGSMGTSFCAGTVAVRVGAEGTSASPNLEFDGSIDDVRLYNRALSAAEMNRIYGLGATTHIGKTITTNLDLENDLAVHYTFDGPDMDISSTTAEVLDSSGNGNNGNMQSFSSTAAALVSGRIGQGVVFDGSNDVVHSGYGTGLDPSSQPITMAAWVLPQASASRYEGVFGDRGAGGDTRAYVAKYNGGWDINVQADSGGSGGYPVVANEWTYLVMVMDGATATLYINGVYNSGYNHQQKSYTSFSLNSDIKFGYVEDYSFSANNFQGVIDDARVYTKALSPEEINRLYQLGKTTHVAKTITTNPDLENGLVGHWTFDGSDVFTQVTDQSGNGNTGYLVSGAATTTASGVLGQALYLDGNDENVDLGDVLDMGTNDMAISLWVKMENPQPNAITGLVTKGAGQDTDEGFALIYQGSGDRLRFYVSDGTTRLSFKSLDNIGIVDGKWHHILANASRGGNSEMYIDGVNAIEPGYETDITPHDGKDIDTDAEPLVFGSWPITYWELKGDLDDVRMYNRTLSYDEVQRLYQLGQ